MILHVDMGKSRCGETERLIQWSVAETGVVSDFTRQPRYREFADLSNHVQLQVGRWGEPDSCQWVLMPIPALEHRSIVETMNLPDGERRVLEFLRDLQGMTT